METRDRSTPTRVAIVQSRLAPFRGAFFERLGQAQETDLMVFCSDGDATRQNAAARPTRSFQLRPLRTVAFGRVAFQLGLPLAILGGRFQVVVAEARLGLVLNPLVLLLCKLTGKRFLWWTCGWEPSESKSVSSAKRVLRRLLFAAAHGGIAYSSAAREYMIRHGMRPERVWVAHNSLDTDSLLAIESAARQDADFARRVKAGRNSQDKPVVLFVGKLTRTKNADVLLRAFEKVSRNHSTATLWVVGDGPERSALQSLPAAANPRIQFLGEVSEANAINSLYMAADVFALPGTGGLAINQAMTFGKPVVVSRADGTEEDLVTDGENGLYFKPGDSDDLAEKILRLLNDSDLRARMGTASRQRILTTINMKNMVSSFCDAIFNRRSSHP